MRLDNLANVIENRSILVIAINTKGLFLLCSLNNQYMTLQ